MGATGTTKGGPMMRHGGVRGPVRALARFFTASARPPERNPDERAAFESLQDWISFGPRPR